ncbi:hypothetical protein IWW37_005249 [Coemansia sp. RSA 2050]|nr:hypothetical protein IWW37_005249 [Coemansia sp. RSA 2050]KAJ2730463.1 hypothetical protein IW152_005223 [Coemansia sp. BCRC 34962]
MESATGVTREEIIRLILCQLSAYGYSSLSQAIATHTKVQMTTESNSRLSELVSAGLQSESKRLGGDMEGDAEMSAEHHEETGGLDLGRAAHGGAAAVMPHYSTWYMTRHKGAATTAAFSRDGRYIATGSVDASLKLIEVDRVRCPLTGLARPEDKPVIRTLYHHTAEITGVAFHPNGLVLASCSVDRTIKLFDLSVAYGKYSFQSMKDNHTYRSIAFHPSGEYLAAGGDGCEVRVYNVGTGKAYLLGSGAQHSAGITRVGYAGSGALVGSSSRDGSVKLWDGATGKCVRTLDRAHGGQAATAVTFSQNSKYVLTTGLDSRVCLWDVGSGRLMHAYEGATLDSPSSGAVFSYDELLVMVADSRLNDVVSWDAVGGNLVARNAQHKQLITCIAPSPAVPAFMTCSADECVRFWSPDDV